MNSTNFLVKDYMRTVVPTVSHGATLKEAVASMLNCGTNGLVVLGDDNRVSGIISSLDVISYLMPRYEEGDERLVLFETEGAFLDRVQIVIDHPVTRFMRQPVRVIQPYRTLFEAAALLSEFRIRQLPVVDELGYLVGCITRTEIKRAIGHALGLEV